MKQAGIYVNEVFCGILTEDEEGFHFAYDEAYLTREDAAAVSPTMPLTAEQYDKEMLAVLLADPSDTEEMAMSFMVGGPKSGFDRDTFMTAFTQSGVPTAVADRMIERMKGNLPVWEELIIQSFLPEEFKTAYSHLLNQRTGLL